jgi:hypothetical protein
MMTMRANRVGLVLLGLVLLAGGAVTLARGLFGPLEVPMVTDQHWFRPAVAAGAITLALTGLTWLLAQRRPHHLPPDLTMEPNPSQGETRLWARAVTKALEADIKEYPGVQGARARLLGTSTHPHLRLNVTCGDHADLAALRRRIADEAIPRLRMALEHDTLPTVVCLRPVAVEKPRTVA